MAKTNGTNKSKAVREYLKANRKAKPGSGRCPGEKGHYDHANYVGNIKATHNKRQRAVRKVVAKGGIGIPESKRPWLFSRLRERCGSDQSPQGGPGDPGDRVGSNAAERCSPYAWATFSR